jgi:hypothetical protein
MPQFESSASFKVKKIGIGDVMVMICMFVSSAVDRGFKHRSDQTNDYTISIGYFTAKHTTLTN